MPEWNTEITLTLTVDKQEQFGAGKIRSREVVEATIGLKEPDQDRVKKFQQFTEKIRRALNVAAAA